jgi:FdhE protein
MTANTLTRDRERPLSASPAPILPDPSSIFLDRSDRFVALAEGHSLSDWLSFLGRLTRVQHELLQSYPPLAVPDEAGARNGYLPPISALSWPRDPFWRKTLSSLAHEMEPHAPERARKTLGRLEAMEAAHMEALADKVLRVDLAGPEADFLPFVAAALQIHWTALAAGLSPAGLMPFETTVGLCPCCSYPAVSAIVRTDRLRYLHCALCNTEWHTVRATCANCGDANHVAYYQIEGGDGGVKAETCDACKGYLKIVYREKSPEADPVADDLASLALDVLVDEAGYDRTGPNLLFAPHS